MRVFIAVELGENAKEEIRKIQEKVPDFMGKLTGLENLHLTLKFLGELDDKQIEKIKQKLREIKLEKFKAEIDEIGVFNENFVRIVWVHVNSEKLLELQKSVDSCLEGLFEKEKRFMSHVTIARVKSLENKKEFLDKLGEIKFEKIKLLVDKFVLKKSILSEKGPEYEDIEDYQLG